MNVTLFSLLLLLSTGASAETQPATHQTRVFCDQPIGCIKPMLAGASLGGNALSYQKPEAVAAARDVGIRFVRLEGVTGAYALYDPNTGRYDWTRLDREIENIQSTGAEIIADIMYTPKWLSRESSGEWYYAEPADYQKWAEYVAEIVRHVNHERKYGIKYWEVWNEPSGGYFFSAWHQGRERFWRLYEVTARAIKEADPTALVGRFGDNMDYPEEFKAFFEFGKQNGVPIDLVTVHWYAEWWPGDGPERPDLYYHLSRQIEALYRSYFEKTPPIFLTEWNLNAEHPIGTPVQQAAFVGSAYFWLQESPVLGAGFFRLEDYKGMGRAMLDGQFGLRPAGRVVKMFASLPSQRLSVCDMPSGMVMLAGRDEDRIAVMASRYELRESAGPIRQQIVLKNPGRKGECQVTIYVEDAGTADASGDLKPLSRTTITIDGDDLALPAVDLERYAVALVVVEFAKR